MISEINHVRIAAMSQVIEYMAEGVRIALHNGDTDVVVKASAELLAYLQPVSVDSGN